MAMEKACGGLVSGKHLKILGSCLIYSIMCGGLYTVTTPTDEGEVAFSQLTVPTDEGEVACGVLENVAYSISGNMKKNLQVIGYKMMWELVCTCVCVSLRVFFGLRTVYSVGTEKTCCLGVRVTDSVTAEDVSGRVERGSVL